MALIFSTGFDGIADTAELGLLSGAPGTISGNVSVVSTGVQGGNCLECSSGTSGAMIFNTVTSSSVTIHLSYWFYWVGGATYLVSGRDSSGDWDGWGVGLSPNGQLNVFRYGDLLQERTVYSVSSTDSLTQDAWHYIEIKVNPANSGSALIKVNGREFINESPIDLVQGGTPSLLYIGMPTGSKIDDFMLFDGTGSDVTDLLGPTLVSTISPDSAGDRTELVPSAGSNWENVDELPNDGDTSYNSSTTVNDGDLYNCTNISNLSSVHFMSVTNYARSEDVNPVSIYSLVKSGTTEFTATQFDSFTDTYDFSTAFYYSNEDTAAGWAVGDFSDIQIGIEVQ